MSEVSGSTLWGDWVLGDLADSVRMIADVLGASAQVVSLRVVPPAPGHGLDSLPTLTVVTRGELQHHRLRHAVTRGEYVPDEVSEPSSTHWSAVVGGVYLVLTVEEAA